MFDTYLTLALKLLPSEYYEHPWQQARIHMESAGQHAGYTVIQPNTCNPDAIPVVVFLPMRTTPLAP